MPQATVWVQASLLRPCTAACKSLLLYSETVSRPFFFMYTNENKLEIQILAKLFAIQIAFSPKAVSRSKALIMNVFFFRVFLSFHHTFPRSSLFLFTLWVLFFFSPFGLLCLWFIHPHVFQNKNRKSSLLRSGLHAKCKNISFNIRSTGGL
jgi:hypothetical protein